MKTASPSVNETKDKENLNIKLLFCDITPPIFKKTILLYQPWYLCS